MKSITEYIEKEPVQTNEATVDDVFIRIPLKTVEAIIRFCEDNRLVDKARRYEDFYNEIKKHFA